MQPAPRVFHYSLDWRFLIPSADLQNVGLLLEEDKHLIESLEQAGMQSSQCLSISDLAQRKNKDLHSIILPFGLATAWVSSKHKDQTDLYSSLRRLIASDGFLLVGFNNVWNFDASLRARYYSSTPRLVTNQLTQAGFHSIEIFGAMRNLAIPEYIFDLESRTVQFALQNRFRRKPRVLRALRALAGTVGIARISNFLPCYYVVATA